MRTVYLNLPKSLKAGVAKLSWPLKSDLCTSNSVLAFAIRRADSIDKKLNLVKPTALRDAVRRRGTPPREEVSTFCVDGLKSKHRLLLLDLFAGKGLKLPVHGRFEFQISVLDNPPISLHIDANWKPERHVDITGWPSSKPMRLARAQALVSKGETIIHVI